MSSTRGVGQHFHSDERPSNVAGDVDVDRLTAASHKSGRGGAGPAAGREKHSGSGGGALLGPVWHRQRAMLLIGMMTNSADVHAAYLREPGLVEEAKVASMKLLQGLVDKAPLHNNNFFSGNDSVIDFDFVGPVN